MHLLSPRFKKLPDGPRLRSDLDGHFPGTNDDNDTKMHCVLANFILFVFNIATSSGDRRGLSNSHHGACVKHNMKLSVQVCCRSEIVGERCHNIAYLYLL